jgi:hypothetical protein
MNATATTALVSSSLETNRDFGTAFAIATTDTTALYVTCQHVIEKVGGFGHALIDGVPVIVLEGPICDAEADLALAVVPAQNVRPLPLCRDIYPNALLRVDGYLLFAHGHLNRTLTATLKRPVTLSVKSRKLPYLELEVTDILRLEDGYSGGPVSLTTGNGVVGVTTFRHADGRRAEAVSIEAVLELVNRAARSNPQVAKLAEGVTADTHAKGQLPVKIHVDSVRPFSVMRGHAQTIYSIAGEFNGQPVFGRGQRIRLSLQNLSSVPLDVDIVEAVLEERYDDYPIELSYQTTRLVIAHSRLPVEQAPAIRWMPGDTPGTSREIGEGRIRLQPSGSDDSIHQMSFDVEALASGLFRYHIRAALAATNHVTVVDRPLLILRRG